MKNLRTPLTASGAVVLALACGACGGGGSSAAPPPTSPSSPSASASASASSSPSDLPGAKAAATSALLTIDDLPTGWSSSTDDSADNTAQDKAFQAKLASCLGVSPALFGDGGGADEADSPDFDSPNGGDTTVSETISVGHATSVDQEYAALRESDASDCLASAFADLLKQSFADSTDASLKTAALGDITVGQLNAGTYGDDTLALRITVPFTVSQQSISLYIDELFIRHDNVVATLQLDGTGTPVDTSTTTQLAELATKKLTAGTFPAG